jgi:hypothetical protein
VSAGGNASDNARGSNLWSIDSWSPCDGLVGACCRTLFYRAF